LAHSFHALFLFRFLTGIGEGAYFSNDRPIIAAYTPLAKRGLGQGVSFIGLGAGMFIGISLAGWISDLWGWRSVFILYAFPLFLLLFSFIASSKTSRQNGRRELEKGKTVQFFLIFSFLCHKLGSG
jgi:predicted MFS family arabinose efflux permease